MQINCDEDAGREAPIPAIWTNEKSRNTLLRQPTLYTNIITLYSFAASSASSAALSSAAVSSSDEPVILSITSLSIPTAEFQFL